jgi:signal transduction histidine kinase
MYRVIQEALVNAAKHAHATLVHVAVSIDDRKLRVVIEDNGVGFSVGPVDQFARHGHFGLLGMRDRVEWVGGSLVVRAAPGTGTTIEATVPLPKTRDAAAPSSSDAI